MFGSLIIDILHIIHLSETINIDVGKDNRSELYITKQN
jgi:hypothetical protein